MYVRINKKARKPVNSNWARIERYKDFKNAFSLMEMMIVLLIVAILAAATAPMVTKKMARSAGNGDSPWVFTGLNSSIAYNLNGNDNAPVIIGASSTPASLTAPTRLFIDSGNTASHIAFGNGNKNPLGITADPTNGRIGISNKAIPNNSVAFGSEQEITNTLDSVVVIGKGAKAKATANNSIVIGEATADKDGSIVIGSGASTEGNSRPSLDDGYNIAIGHKATAKSSVGGAGAIAIGSSAYASVLSGNAIAIGDRTQATGPHSVAIGYNAEATKNNQIALGDDSATVFIRGNLVVLGNVVLGSAGKKCIVYAPDNERYGILRKYSGNNNGKERAWYSDEAKNSNTLEVNGSSYNYYSDRRLKNVGEAYTAGLDELKKLDFFHYTFKKDEAKTPHVGVMAQDLEKVFPNAVTKGEDGYLRIRMEDMFYAVINAVKELDTKITEIVENVTSLSKKVDEQEKTIAEQQKLIEDLEQRLAQVEKNRKKVVE